jgi:hypothetical protein
MGGMTAGGKGIGSSFSLKRIVSCLDAGGTVADQGASAIPAEGAGELASVAGAGLVGASHGVVTVMVTVTELNSFWANSPL